MRALLAAAILVGFVAPGGAAGRLTIWDIALGQAAASLPSAEFQNFACGTDGGPPSLALGGFGDYATCPADANGLFEVAFAYDDEDEYVARALEDEARIRQLDGTQLYGFKVLVSVLFDAQGIARTLRIATDPRVSDHDRANAARMERFVRGAFPGDWRCTDHPPQPGYTPFSGTFIDRECVEEDRVKGVVRRLAVHNFRRPGQVEFDPVTRQPTAGQFESFARLEIFLAAN